ncbi:MAG: hypothetical protein ABW095_15290 [Candidatus Thiodiazotropha sp.]
MGFLSRKWVWTTLASLTLLGNAQAAIVDLGDYTTDTDTGLTWLDVNRTSDWSHNQVSQYLGDGNALAGYSDWRYATSAELNTLLGHFGLNAVSGLQGNTHAQQDNDLLLSAMTLLGITRDFGNGRGADLTGLLGDVNSDNGAATTYWVATLHYNSPPSNAFSQLHSGNQSGSTSHTNMGSFLVRTSPVPIPAALPLFASALGLFGLLSWKRRTSAQA